MRLRLLLVAGWAFVATSIPTSAVASAAPVGRLDDPVLLAVTEASDGAVVEPAGRRGIGLAAVPGDDGTVSVELAIPDAGAERTTQAAVEAHRGRVTGVAAGSWLQAEVPVDELEMLAAEPGVGYLRATRAVSARPTGRPITSAPAAPIGSAAATLTAEAVASTGAAAWHADGVTGAGVRIGIIDYFNATKWDAAVAAGDLPVPAGTFCRDSVGDGYDECPGGSVFLGDDVEEGHGNAVAEIIHDLAPDAELYLARGVSLNDLYLVIDMFVANGVHLVNRSLGAPLDGPGTGRSPRRPRRLRRGTRHHVHQRGRQRRVRPVLAGPMARRRSRRVARVRAW
ncbi:MAG: hypothetical protein R2715_19265 [Ilumatobacteraceae bacterium]